MSMPNDDEMEELSRYCDQKQLQRITPDLIQHIRDMVDQKISTGKISAKVAERLREEWANHIAWQDSKLDEHDHRIGEHEGFISKVRRAFFGVVKG